MGMAKRIMMEQDEHGWSYSDKSVCTACVDDDALCAAIGPLKNLTTPATSAGTHQPPRWMPLWKRLSRG